MATGLEVAVIVLLARSVVVLMSPPASTAQLRWMAGGAAACGIAHALCWAWGLAVSHQAAYDVLSLDLRARLTRQVGRVPLGFASARRRGEWKKLVSDDVEHLELFVAHGIPELVSAAVVWVCITCWLAASDWRLTLTAVTIVMNAFWALRGDLSGSAAYRASVNRAWGVWNGALAELLAGLRALHLLHRGRMPFEHAEQAAESYAAREQTWSRAFCPLGTVFHTFMGATLAFLLPVGLWLHRTGRIADPDLVVFLVVGAGYSVPLLRFYLQTMRLSMMVSAGGKIQELLDAPWLPDTGRHLPLHGRSVEFRKVRFAYDETDHPALEEVSFLAREGTLTALVGPSGSGKTTIVRLIPRFWDVTAGSVLVGGVDIREMAVEQLMEQVSFVFQETFFFEDTVAANLRVGRPGASADEIKAAVRAARADDFIVQLPHGYDAVIGLGGATLSAGQRQRLAIARALLRDAPILVLNEATVLVDPDNEALIQEALSKLIAGRAVLVVAHRLTTIRGADRILVLERGRIIERGTHTALLVRSGVYGGLWTDTTAGGASPLECEAERGDGVMMRHPVHSGIVGIAHICLGLAGRHRARLTGGSPVKSALLRARGCPGAALHQCPGGPCSRPHPHGESPPDESRMHREHPLSNRFGGARQSDQLDGLPRRCRFPASARDRSAPQPSPWSGGHA